MATHYEPLYLKYRPQTLADLIGQDSVKQTLVNAINKERLVHAYLFTGPRGAGKTSTARILAKCLNCLSASSLPTPDPCGTCTSCLDIASSTSLDVIEIDAASHGGVEDARALIERVNLGTISGNFKVYIIDEVHMLSSAAFNALLKVFEEPPEKVIFILATTEEDKVLATIRSRCQTLQFRPISIKDCVSRLEYVAKSESIVVEKEALEFIARRSDGAMRDALGLLDQASAFSNGNISKNEILDYLGGVAREDIQALFTPVLERDANQLLSVLDSLFDKGKEPLTLTRELISYALDLLEQGDTKVENFELVQIIEQLSLAEERLRRSTQSKNFIRAALLKLIYRQDIVVLGELQERVAALEAGGGVKPVAKPSVPAAAPKPYIAPVAQAAKPQTFIQEPVKETAAPVSAASCLARSDYASVDFIEYLSPACKGLLASSNARFNGVDNGAAIIQIPDRFKFLKIKLETKAAEIVAALAKTGLAPSSLNIEIVENDAMTGLPPHLDPNYQEQQVRSLKADDVDMDPAELKAEKLDTQISKVENRSDEVEAEKVPKSFKSSKLQEAVSMTKSVFNAKVLD